MNNEKKKTEKKPRLRAEEFGQSCHWCFYCELNFSRVLYCKSLNTETNLFKDQHSFIFMWPFTQHKAHFLKHNKTCTHSLPCPEAIYVHEHANNQIVKVKRPEIYQITQAGRRSGWQVQKASCPTKHNLIWYFTVQWLLSAMVRNAF